MSGSLCVVHNNVDSRSSIGKIAKWGVEQALEGGWHVTVVARDLDRSLAGQVRHLPLHVPRRLHLYQWLAARRTVRQAIGDRTFDVVHVHQPQLGCDAEVLQCHFLSRSAKQSSALARVDGVRSALTHAQQRAVVAAEDRAIRAWPSRLRVLFDSELLRGEHDRHYNRHPNGDVLLYPAPPTVELDDVERRAARQRWAPDAASSERVVGFLGGTDNRKGGDALVAAAAKTPNVYVLGAGTGTSAWTWPELGRRQRWVGYVDDITDFLKACDLLAVPSRFEPFGLVCFEAASVGVPVIATDQVGALKTLLEHGAGFRWADGLPAALEALARDSGRSRRLAYDMARMHSPAVQGEKLLAIYAEIVGSNARA